jgi:hypothetical protein
VGGQAAPASTPGRPGRVRPQLCLVDSVAVPICRFARAYRAGGCGSWPPGPRRVAKQTDLGLRAHLRVCWPGVIVDGCLAPANLSDLAVGEELLAEVTGWTLADRSYGSARLANWVASQGGWLLAPARGTRRSRQRPPPWLTGKRRRVETVIGQLTGRYQLKRVWARDARHLWSRWQRKLLSSCRYASTGRCDASNPEQLSCAAGGRAP